MLLCRMVGEMLYEVTIPLDDVYFNEWMVFLVYAI